MILSKGQSSLIGSVIALLIVLLIGATLLIFFTDAWDPPFEETVDQIGWNGEEDQNGEEDENDDKNDDIDCNEVCSDPQLTDRSCTIGGEVTGCEIQRDCGDYSDVCDEVMCGPC